MSNMSKKKCGVFSVEEQLKLLHFIEKEKHIIENKVTNKVTNGEKDVAWGRITRAYNSTSSQLRTADQLKSKYDNLKTKTRKLIAVNRSSFKKTGGGGAETTNYDAVVEAVLAIINPRTVYGYENSVDCDNDDNVNIFDDEMNESFHSQDQRADVNLENDSFLNPNENVSLVVSTTELDNSTTLQLEQDFFVTPVVSTQNVENKPADIEVHTKSSNKRKAVESTDGGNEVAKNLKNDNVHNWSSYTTKKLQTPISKKLRPGRDNPVLVAKAEYYKQKALNVETDIWLKRQQEERRAAEENRKKDEHERRMKLLDLEIKIKEKQLSNM